MIISMLKVMIMTIINYDDDEDDKDNDNNIVEGDDYNDNNNDHDNYNATSCTSTIFVLTGEIVNGKAWLQIDMYLKKPSTTAKDLFTAERDKLTFYYTIHASSLRQI